MKPLARALHWLAILSLVLPLSAASRPSTLTAPPSTALYRTHITLRRPTDPARLTEMGVREFRQARCVSGIPGRQTHAGETS